MLAVACLLLLALQPGCIRTLALAGKVFAGDPKVKSVFQQKSGVALSKGQHVIAVVCTAPVGVSDALDLLAGDVQQEASRQMRLQGINVLRDEQVQRALRESRGRFDHNVLARELPEADYLAHVQIERLSRHEEASPDLLRGRAQGKVSVYEVRRRSGAEHPAVVLLFESEFQVRHPRSHPVPRDQTSERVFQRQFIEAVSRVVGRTFHDVKAGELIDG